MDSGEEEKKDTSTLTSTVDKEDRDDPLNARRGDADVSTTEEEKQDQHVRSHYFDDDRPRYHIQPPTGWMNDPNGPIYYRGRYHMFYQHLPESCEWDFGIIWGHVVSSDLITWEHLPPAIVPTPGWVDADGCFSGCCLEDSSGRPMIMYTGVRLRSNTAAGPLPPPEQDLGMVFIESQCLAVPEDDDDLLIKWKKIEKPFLALPPLGLDLTGWRDPFVFASSVMMPKNNATESFVEDKNFGEESDSIMYRMLMGSGIKGQGGTALVYRSSKLTDGWELEGTLCVGQNLDTGVVWECPLLVPLDVIEGDYGQSFEPPPWLVGKTSNTGAGETSRHGIHGIVADQKLLNPTLGNVIKDIDVAHGTKNGLDNLEQSHDQKFGPREIEVKHSKYSSEFEFKLEPADAESQYSAAMTESVKGEEIDSENIQNSTRSSSGGEVEALASKLERAATLESWAATRTGSSASGSARLYDTDLQEAANGPSSESFQSSLSNFHRDKNDDQKSNSVSENKEEEIDRFALAHSKVRSIAIARSAKSSATKSSDFSRGPFASDSHQVEMSKNYLENARLKPRKQWHFFTVSPDAPTNPVLYWTGHLFEEKNEKGINSMKFDLETAKGPYRLDLGDILYAPNVCQDGQGRWLLWGWLQERRKMGTYNYAGCLTVPRILSCTKDGRLIQAPSEEVALLRKEKCFEANDIALFPDAVFPIKDVKGVRLDIECTIERGNAIAAGLLFHSHEAEAEGSTAIIYDWDRNQLEAIFNVPSNWQPAAVDMTPSCSVSAGVEGDVFDDFEGVFDPAAVLCTPRNQMSSCTSLMGASSSASMAALGGNRIGTRSSSRRTSLESRTESVDHSSLSETIHFDEEGIGIPSQGIARSGSSLSLCLQRPGSLMNNAASFKRTGSMLGQSMPRVLSRRTSFAGTPQTGMIGTESGLIGNSLVNLDGVQAESNPPEEDLGHLLEDLAAPMRTADEPAPPPPEPRRVGGGLRMNPADKLHLRIIVDHSCVEVFTGTGEVLSTRIYRGRCPPYARESGIDFVAFGGAALLKKVQAYEVDSAWTDYEATPRAFKGIYFGQEENKTSPASTIPYSAAAMASNSLEDSGDKKMSTVRLAEEIFDEILMELEPPSNRFVTAQ